MVLRFVPKNQVMQHLASELNLLEGQGICVITHFKEDEEKLGPVIENINRRRAEFCAKKAGRTLENTRYVVLVTAGCRMGENLPPDCNIMASLGINHASSMATVLQDTGRVLGYKPGAYILTSDVGCEKLRAYSEHRYEGVLHHNTSRATKQTTIKFCRGAYLRGEIPKMNVPLGLTATHPMIDKLCDYLERELVKHGNFGRKRSYAGVLQPYMDILNALAHRQQVDLLEYDGPIYFTRRTKRDDNDDKDGGKKLSDDVIVRVQKEFPHKVLSVEWQLQDPLMVKSEAKGGLSKKLRKAA
jgi:hypothetical protein